MLAPIAALRSWNRRRPRVFRALVNSPVAFGLLIIALLASGWNYLVAESSRDRVAEANTILLETERLFSSVKDLETGERGFVLVGGENYLIPYDGARVAIDRSLATLKRLTHGDLRRAFTGEKSLETLVAEKRDFAARVVALRKEQGFEAATELVRTGEGKRVMDAIRLEAGAIRDRLDARVAKIQRSDRLRGLALALLTGAASWSAVALLAGLLLMRRDDALQGAALTEALLDEAPVGLGCLDRDLRLIRANRTLAEMTGLALGRDVRSALPSLAAPLESACLRGVATSGVPVGDGPAMLRRASLFPLTQPNEDGVRTIAAVGLMVCAAPAP